MYPNVPSLSHIVILSTDPSGPQIALRAMNGKKIKVKPDEEQPSSIEDDQGLVVGDEMRLRQVVNNLARWVIAIATLTTC